MILLDTHTAVWLASDQSKLSVDVKKALSLHADNLHISVVSAWEISMLYRRKRLRLPEIHNDPFDRILIAMCQTNEWTLLSKDSVIAKYPDIRVVW